MILAYLLLLTGLTISAVAIYYSVVGLTAIFSAAVIPIIVMGSALEVGKLVCASWLKANWTRAPAYMKYYMISAVMVLMIITSMGIFGFLSKAHNDQNLVSGDVQSKIAIYDEKIKTAKENIESDRKQLKQMDEAVDQVMGRSQDEKGADKAVSIRKAQSRDRSALAKDIETNQKLIASLNDQAAPVRAEVRKVEAEVGPIKYIAKFIYGEHGADENMLEKAVTWIIVLIVVVFDPLAVIMLLAAQMTFGWKKEQNESQEEILHGLPVVSINDIVPQPQEFIPKEESAEDDSLTTESADNIVVEPTVIEPTADQTVPINTAEPIVFVADEDNELAKWNKMIEKAERQVAEESTVEERVAKGETYINGQGEEVVLVNKAQHQDQSELNFDKEEQPNYEPDDSPLTADQLRQIQDIADSKKKTYMIKDLTGKIQTKNKE